MVIRGPKGVGVILSGLMLCELWVGPFLFVEWCGLEYNFFFVLFLRVVRDKAEQQPRDGEEEPAAERPLPHGAAAVAIL